MNEQKAILTWLPFTANSTTTTQKQSDYVVERSSFPLIALVWLKIGRYRGQNRLYGNQAFGFLWQSVLKYNLAEGWFRHDD